MQTMARAYRAAVMIAALAMLAPLEAVAGEFEPNTSVTIDGRTWLINGQPVHAGSKAEGLLMNVRMINVAFEDTGPAARNLPDGFDPDENTNRFQQTLPCRSEL